jgi:hypothetical protein
LRGVRLIERSRLGMSGDGGEGGEGLAPFAGVPFDLGLAMLANLANGLLEVSVSGVVTPGDVARDLRSSTILFKGVFPPRDLEGW